MLACVPAPAAGAGVGFSDIMGVMLIDAPPGADLSKATAERAAREAHYGLKNRQDEADG